MIVFRVSLSFDPMKKNTEIAISDLYFSEKSDYSEENISDNENFRSTILQPFQFEPEQKKFVVMRARRKKLNIFTFSCRSITYQNRKSRLAQIRTLKSYVREIDCPCCREVDALLIASAKILQRKGSILPSNFYGQLPDYQSQVLALSTQQITSSFCSECS